MYNFLKTLHVIYRIERDNISYRELIEFLYKETPPSDYNFLNYNYAPHIGKVIKYGSGAKTKPLFSVIIPTYNRQKLLAGTLQAAISQKDIPRSEEHTSELQSHVNLVCRLLLEKKN